MSNICSICGIKTDERKCDICEKPICRECAKFMVTYVEDYLCRRQMTLRVCPKCKISFRKSDELFDKFLEVDRG